MVTGAFYLELDVPLAMQDDHIHVQSEGAFQDAVQGEEQKDQNTLFSETG